MATNMIDWNDVDTVLLDMDGTLLDLYFDNFFWQEYLPNKWGELHNVDQVSAKDRLIPQFKSKVGTLSFYCLDYWTEQLNIDVFSLKSDVEHLIKIRPYVEEFLTFLNSSNKRVYLVTNAHQKLITLKMQRTGIDKYFDNIFSSHRLGKPKEDACFWSCLNKEISFAAEKTVLIDDNLTVLRSAREYGIIHLLTIVKPDSRLPDQDIAEFVGITSFQHLYS